MRSFDFYDSLVVRLVASPADIFSLVGERLDIPDFRSMRLAAEIRARDALGGEVTFEQIYGYVVLPPELKQKALALEFEFERSLIAPVNAVLSKFQTGDLIVSDMYHDERLYREVMERLLPGIEPGAVLISGATGVNKATGGLWKKVTAEYPELQSHIGDNLLGDVRQARRCGVVAEYFDGAILNRYEKTLAGKGGDGSMIAGASRAARLSLVRSDSSPADIATIEVFASVIGPLIHAFVSWIMRTCDEEGIRDVYFLARDGQLPSRMCSRLLAENGQDLRCHYIYASRHALHLPGCDSIDDAESWLLDNTPQLTLRIIAERACVPLEILANAASSHISVGPDENIPHSERGLLGSVIRDPSFVAALMASVNRAYKSAAAYYLAQGFAGKGDAALVDVGWNGRLQRSLGSLLEKSGNRPPKFLGLYLSLNRRLSNAPGDDLRGFLGDPERPEQAAFFYQYGGILESALIADHPTTVGFEVSDGVAHPVLGVPYSRSIQRKIALQHAAFDAFVENLILLGRAAGRSITVPAELAIDNFKKFATQPTHADGLAFVDFPFVGGQTGNDAMPISRILKITDLLKSKRNLGYWTEGSLSASGFSTVAYVRRSIWRLRKRARLATTVLSR